MENTKTSFKLPACRGVSFTAMCFSFQRMLTRPVQQWLFMVVCVGWEYFHIHSHKKVRQEVVIQVQCAVCGTLV